MKRVLFLIHDLGPGGAEKVLVNLVNWLDPDMFDVTVKTLFDWGVNRGFLNPRVNYEFLFDRDIPGNSHWMKLWTPEQLYHKTVTGDYDIVVSDGNEISRGISKLRRGAALLQSSRQDGFRLTRCSSRF